MENNQFTGLSISQIKMRMDSTINTTNSVIYFTYRKLKEEDNGNY